MDEPSTPEDLEHRPTPDQSLVEVLAESQRLGFLGPGPVESHVEHAAGFLQLLGQADRVLDLGSGGGVPGLVLAVRLPDTEFVLLDAMDRRCRFLRWAVDELDLAERVRVVHGRAEDQARRTDLRGRFPVVVTRSFGSPAVTAECAVGFVAWPGGRILVSEPPTVDEERWPPAGLASLGLVAAGREAGSGWSVQVLEISGPVDDRLPRRVGVPGKRPAF